MGISNLTKCFITVENLIVLLSVQDNDYRMGRRNVSLMESMADSPSNGS
jgi:hypothetical protein